MVKPIKNKKLRVAAEQAAPSSHDCDHSFCKRVHVALTHTLLAEYKQLDVTQKQAKAMVRFIPSLLCGVGDWPPRNLDPKLAKLLYLIFCLVCVDVGAEGLRGQELPGYSEVATKFAAARAAEAEAKNTSENP